MQIIDPNKAITGNPLILGFNSKGLSISGFFFLKASKLILTKIKLMSTPMTVACATSDISPNRIGIIVKPIVNRTEIIGVLYFGEILLSPLGSALSRAIPYIIREVTISIMRTVFAVAKRAMNDIIVPPNDPNTSLATVFNGASDAAI